MASTEDDQPTELIVIRHGDNPDVPRPPAGVVRWIGSVEPANATVDDEFTDTVNKVAKLHNGSGFDTLGSAASSAPGPSAQRLALVSKTGIALTAGGVRTLDFTGASVTKGANYWGVPDSAQDLDVTVGSGGITMPAGLPDCHPKFHYAWDVAFDPADAGKLVTVKIGFNDWSLVLPLMLGATSAGNTVHAEGGTFDENFVSDTSAITYVATVDASQCAHDLSVNLALEIWAPAAAA